MKYERVHWKYVDVDVDAKMARELLATSKGNRKISQRQVHRYARDMILGHWDTAGDGTFITVYEGVMSDGNHRLNGVIEADKTDKGITIPMTIRIPDRKPVCFDLNKSRSAKDIIDMDNGIHGHPANARVTTMVRFIWENVFKVKNAGRATEFDVKDYYEDHDDTLTEANRLCEYCVKGNKALLKNGMGGVAIYGALRYGVPYKTVEKFVRIVNTGLYDAKNETAAIALRNYIILLDNTVVKGEGRSEYRKAICGLTQRAILDFANGVSRVKPYKKDDAIYTYTDYVKENDEKNYIIPEKKPVKEDGHKKESKHKFGEYKHVLLTDNEYARLVNDFGKEKIVKAIKKVDEYCQLHGRQYKDYNLAIRKWGVFS